jgi:hypothetical protein
MGAGLRIIKATDLTGNELEDITGITGEPTQCVIGEFFKLKRSDNQKYYISSTKVTSVETIDDSKRPEIKILQVKTRDKIYYLATDAVYRLYNKK